MHHVSLFITGSQDTPAEFGIIAHGSLTCAENAEKNA